MTIDLGDLYDLDEIIVYTYWDGSRYYHYDLMVSTDGTMFETITTKDSNEIRTENGDSYSYDDVTARYVRIQINYNSSQWGNIQLCELEVYGDLHQRTEEENILRDKVFKNGMDDSEITTLTDGSTDTVFSVGSEAELLIDLEQWHMIDENIEAKRADTAEMYLLSFYTLLVLTMHSFR